MYQKYTHVHGHKFIGRSQYEQIPGGIFRVKIELKEKLPEQRQVYIRVRLYDHLSLSRMLKPTLRVKSTTVDPLGVSWKSILPLTTVETLWKRPRKEVGVYGGT